MTDKEQTLPLAQQALNIMDEYGENRMMVFVHNNSDSRPQTHEINAHSLNVLTDHTAVAHSKEVHTFVWNEPHNDTVRLVTQIRPAINPAPYFKLPKGRAAHVAGAPSYENILWRALKELEKECMDDAGIKEDVRWLGEEPELLNDTGASLAPGLLELAARAAAPDVDSDMLWEIMEDYVHETTKDILPGILENERTALKQAIHAALLLRHKLSPQPMD